MFNFDWFSGDLWFYFSENLFFFFNSWIKNTIRFDFILNLNWSIWMEYIIGSASLDHMIVTFDIFFCISLIEWLDYRTKFRVSHPESLKTHMAPPKIWINYKYFDLGGVKLHSGLKERSLNEWIWLGFKDFAILGEKAFKINSNLTYGSEYVWN